MRGKRKGRGGRKGPTTSDVPSDSPKRKDSRLEFQSPCLSHASPPITKFFSPQSKELDSIVIEGISKREDTSAEENALSVKCSSNDDTLVVEPTVIENGSSDKRPVEICKNSHEEERCNDDENSRSQSPATPHKITLIQDSQPTLLSPSSALSQLTIANGGLKKASKSRRKLNPNQTANQLAPSSTGPKLNCCPKTKASTDCDTRPPSVAASTNGSQSKVTDFFQVRRSVRKTKKTVLEEKQRTLEEAVLMGKEEGLEIHNFEGKGRGIVARSPFAKGEFVVEYAGELIKMDEAREREKLYAQDQNTGCYMYYFKYRNQQFCVDATPESTRLGRLVNHSRNGNLVTKTITVDNTPRLVLIAKEDIQSGEEVTYDYGDRSKESLKHHPWLAC